MSQRVMTKLSFILAFGAALPSLQAEKRTTDRLADEADAIVVGEVQSGRQSGYSVAFVLSVTRTLKGDLPPGAVVNVTWGCALRANKDLKANYGLWFLRREGGQWTLRRVLEGTVPFEFSYFPLPRQRTPANLPAGGPPLSAKDLVAAELVAALQICTDRSQLHHLASGLLGIGESSVAPELFRALRASGGPELKFMGLAGLLRANDMSALAEIADNVDLIPRLELRGLVLGAISARRDAEPAAISHLGRIAATPDPDLRRAAAEALKRIHTRDTVPFLVQLLESTDPGTREAAMFGLSRFVDNLPIETPYNVPSGKSLVPQGPQTYRTAETDRYSLSTRRVDGANEADHVRFWRSWWVTMKDKVMAAPGPPVGPPAP
jgi:hypothetical protein